MTEQRQRYHTGDELSDQNARIKRAVEMIAKGIKGTDLENALMKDCAITRDEAKKAIGMARALYSEIVNQGDVIGGEPTGTSASRRAAAQQPSPPSPPDPVSDDPSYSETYRLRDGSIVVVLAWPPQNLIGTNNDAWQAMDEIDKVMRKYTA